MIALTVQEQDELGEAIWMAAEGLREVRKVLASIGERRGRKWYPDNPNHIRDMAGFIADVSLPSDCRLVAKHFADDRYWLRAA